MPQSARSRCSEAGSYVAASPCVHLPCLYLLSSCDSCCLPTCVCHQRSSPLPVGSALVPLKLYLILARAVSISQPILLPATQCAGVASTINAHPQKEMVTPSLLARQMNCATSRPRCMARHEQKM